MPGRCISRYTTALAVGVTLALPASAGAQITVQPGETLSGLAAYTGVSTEELAAVNGLDPDGLLLAGETLALPGDAGYASDSLAGAPAGMGPYPTDEIVSPGLVGQIAADHGVSPSLAEAIAEQESGFDNAAVSSADARGVMQILPSTWDYIQENLAGSTLDPASAYDNVHAGVMFLGDLLAQTGGDEATAAASYYQGPASVQTDGLLPETQDYVDNVMALRSQYGGP